MQCDISISWNLVSEMCSFFLKFLMSALSFLHTLIYLPLIFNKNMINETFCLYFPIIHLFRRMNGDGKLKFLVIILHRKRLWLLSFVTILSIIWVKATRVRGCWFSLYSYYPRNQLRRPYVTITGLPEGGVIM